MCSKKIQNWRKHITKVTPRTVLRWQPAERHRCERTVWVASRIWAHPRSFCFRGSFDQPASWWPASHPSQTPTGGGDASWQARPPPPRFPPLALLSVHRLAAPRPDEPLGRGGRYARAPMSRGKTVGSIPHPPVGGGASFITPIPPVLYLAACGSRWNIIPGSVWGIFAEGLSPKTPIHLCMKLLTRSVLYRSRAHHSGRIPVGGREDGNKGERS